MSQPSKVSLLLPLATSLLFFGFTEGSCGGLAVAPQPLTRPTPTACEDLDEAACTARADCRADYSHEGMCACPACEPGAGCPPCECNETETFLGCVTPGPCEGLDEAACNAAPGCEAQYALPPCVAQCDSDDECDVFICPDEPVYVGCTEPVQCGPVCDIWCEFGHAIDENGCELCACNPPPPVCGPVCDIWCEFGNVIDENGCELCACNPPPGPTCTSDAECPNGFCDVPPHCGFCGDENGPDCPEYVGMCVFPSCDDGQPVLCDALPPECGPGQVAAARNGCWACVDARTCGEEPPPPPEGCETDADCPGGFCESGATCAGVDCPPPPPGICVWANCDDGQPVLCDALPPDCGPGQIAAARNGCWACVDARTCN